MGGEHGEALQEARKRGIPLGHRAADQRNAIRMLASDFGTAPAPGELAFYSPIGKISWGRVLLHRHIV
jgi:hypothetical protein